MKIKKIAYAVLATSLFTSVLAGCGAKEDDAAKNDGGAGAVDTSAILRTVVADEIPTLDPSKSTDNISFTALGNVMEGLYRMDNKEEATPAIAESVETSADGLTYTFKLRKDAVWSDGQPVKAQEFIYSWQRTLDPATASQYSFILFYIKNAQALNEGKVKPEELGAKAIDDHTLEVTLEKPTAYFLSLTAFPVYYPQRQDVVEKYGDKYGTEAANFIYNGPFTMTEWEHQVGYKLTKNDSYYDAESIQLAGVDAKVVKEASTIVNLYDSGELDIAPLTAEHVEQYKESEEFHTRQTGAVFFLRLNEKIPALKNTNVRRAIATAFDKQAFVDNILNNGSVPANYLVPKNFAMFNGKDFRDISGEHLNFDVAVAQEAWKKGLAELGQKEVKLSMIINDDDVGKQIGQYLQGQLETNLPGLKVELKPMPFKQSLEKQRTLDYDIAWSGWGPDYLDPATFLDMFRTGDAFNEMDYSSKKYDDLLVQASKELDVTKRADLLAQAEKVLSTDDAALAPVFQRGTSFLVRPNVKNMTFHIIAPEYDYRYVTIEKQ
ncbi:MAG: peptide ABC transporter substrate-binding protein [Bacilli bacterium]